MPQPLSVDIEGETIVVHPLSAGQLAKLINSIEDLKKCNEAFVADFELLRISCKDADGKAVFATVQEAMDVPPTVAAQLIPACLKVNGMGQHDEKKVD